MFRINPTIRQTNKYLSEVVEDLSVKHGGVSNEDFESELIAITGIGWKQVKNYKNHPKPGDRLKDNAVVLKFVLKKQKTEKWRNPSLYGAIATLTLTLLTGIYLIATRPRPIEQFVVHQVPPSSHRSDFKETKVYLKLDSKSWTFRLGPFEHSSVPISKFQCTAQLELNGKQCSFQESDRDNAVQATVYLDGGIIRRYSIMTNNEQDVESLLNQLRTMFGNQLSDFPSADKQIDEIELRHGNESVQVTSSDQSTGMRPYIAIVVSLK